APPALTAVQRYRLRATAGVRLPPPQPWTKVGLVGYARSPATWRQLAYHLLAAPRLAVSAPPAVAMWLAGLAGTLVYAYAWLAPGLLSRDQSSPPPGYL